MDPDAIVQAVQQLNDTIQIGQTAQENYFKGLEEKIGDLANALGKEKSIGEDNRRGSNAYKNSRAYRSSQEFLQLPPDKRKQAGWQYRYGVLDEKGTPATGRYNLRRNVGLLNLPEAHNLLEGGHFQQAGYQVASGLLQSPYSRPFTIPTGLRLGAQGLDIARNRVIGQRLGQPNVLGMTGGVMGPGVEDFSSGLGSYVASLTAFPSMFASRTGQPFSMFGGSMAPAVSQGYQMRKEAFMRSLNPFGMMGYQQNLSIIEAARSKGFRSLGETYNVSDSAKEIMQSVGIEAGTAIDIIDIAIKRLGMDTKEAQQEMEVFGKMARGAGKGVAQFAQETLQVLNQMSLQNTRGPGALRASALMSSVPQVSGEGIFNLINSPTLTGLTMGTMAGQGASMGTLASMAMGYPFAAGGGREALQMTSQSLGTYKQYVDQFMRTMPGENEKEKRQNAFNMAAQVFGLDGPMTAERIYEQTDKVQNQASVLSSLEDFETVQSLGVKGQMKAALGMGGKGFASEKVGKGYKTLREQFQSGRESWKGGKGELPLSMKFGGQGASGVYFKDPSGQDDQQFNLFVQRMVAAKRFKSEPEQDVIDAAEEAGLDSSEVLNAANLYIAAGRGDDQNGRAAFAKLADQYNISVGGFQSEDLKKIGEKRWATMDKTAKEEYMSSGTKALDEALSRGLIKQPQYEKQLALLQKGQFDSSSFEKMIMGEAAAQTLGESRQLVDLTDDAKKLLKLLPDKPASRRSRTGG